MSSPRQVLRLLWERAHPPGRPTTPRLTTTKVKAIVREYTGKPPASVDWVPDPKVPGVTAIRATLAEEQVLDLIVHHHDTGYDVEEVKFKSWPPRSI